MGLPLTACAHMSGSVFAGASWPSAFLMAVRTSVSAAGTVVSSAESSPLNMAMGATANVCPMMSPRSPAWMIMDLPVSAAMTGFGARAAAPRPMMPSSAVPAAARERTGEAPPC